MKNGRKIISLIMVIAMVIACVPFGAVNTSAAATQYFSISDAPNSQFSSTQGQNNWYYMWGWDPADYREMNTYTSGGGWTDDRMGGVTINNNFMHPAWGDTDNYCQAVYAWKAPKAGRVKIAGNYGKWGLGGNGIDFRIYHNGDEIFYYGYAPDVFADWGTNGLTNQWITVTKNDFFYFSVNPRGDGDADSGGIGIWLDYEPNDGPNVEDSSINAYITETATGLINADGQNLTYTVTTQPANGTVMVNQKGAYIYDITNEAASNDSFVVSVSDGVFPAVTATVYVTIGSRWQTNTQLETDAGYKTFWKPEKAWVGDPMPYYSDGKFQFFYLSDERNVHDTGSHSVGRATSTDLLNWKDEGDQIKHGVYGEQDLGVGTGSVIKVGSTYHMYYTGNNYLWQQQGLPAREQIMRATSTDGMKTWQKDTVYRLGAPAGYNTSDWRDPQIIFNAENNKYVMLVSTNRTTYPRGAVIYYYESTDCVTWTDMGELYRNTAYGVMECADLFKVGSRWYLIYSEYGTTRYVYRDGTLGTTWTKPAFDAFDTVNFYAAKTASDGTDRYIFGWVPTKNGELNTPEATWGGNMAVHKIVVNPDGTLGVAIPHSYLNNYYTDTLTLPTSRQSGTGTWNYNGTTSTMTTTGSALALAGNMYNNFKISGTLTMSANTGDVGFVLGSNDAKTIGHYIKFDPVSNTIRHDYLSGGSYVTQTSRSVEINPSTNYDIELVVENSIMTMYINNQVAYTSRMYGAAQGRWGIYSYNNDASLSGIAVKTNWASQMAEPKTESYVMGNVNGSQYSDTQGENNWYYMWGWSPGDYRNLDYNAGTDSWRATPHIGVEINNGWSHTQWGLSDTWAQPVYCWRAPEDGKIKVNGSYTKDIYVSGNGVALRIYANSAEIAFGAFTSGQSKTFQECGLDGTTWRNVKKGENYFFSINPDGNGDADGGNMEIHIDYLRIPTVPKIQSDTLRISPRDITGIQPGMTVLAFKAALTATDGTISVLNKAGAAPFDTDLVTTGMKVQLTYSANVVQELVAVIYGDIDGDGQIGVTDITALKKAILEIEPLSGTPNMAADINKDGEKGVNDIIAIKRHIVDIEAIAQ